MKAPDVPIHLSWDNPYRGRPKALCGAKLRVGMVFSWYEDHLTPNKLSTTNLKAVRVRTGRNTTSTQFVMKTKYNATICPRCLKSDDYNLALLAVLP
jgi:NMD protein affecting ribosome stability and mRNA decay